MNDKTKTSVGLGLKHRLGNKAETAPSDSEKKILTPSEIARNSMKSSLTLDVKSVKPARTRNELYNELTKNDKVMEEEDYYEFPSPATRGVALAIDAVFAYVVFNVATAAAPLGAKIWHALFLDKYKLQFIFGEEAMIDVIRYLSVLAGIFFLIVIPVAFFNQSLGKKIAKIKVRGDHIYTLKLSQTFLREIVYKPIGIIFLVGFILPFFDKKKKSLHDRLLGTIVVKE